MRWLALVMLAACQPAVQRAGEDTGGALARISRGGAVPHAAASSDSDEPATIGRWIVTDEGLGGAPYGSDELLLAEVPPTVGYTALSGPTVMVEGVVRDPLTSVPGDAACGPEPVVRVAWLEGVSHGVRLARGLPGQVLRDACGLHPRLQLVAPIGGTLTVDNQAGDATLSLRDPAGKRAQHPLLEGSSRLVSLRASGVFELVSPQASPAWVVVPPSPYAATVGADGRFVLGDVPPGAYTLVVVASSAGSAPREKRQQIQVPAQGSLRITVDLPR